MDIILETKDLTKTYKAGGNHINAVDHTSICVERGDFVTIVGKSGSGKSTLLHLIGGLDYPTSGEVWIDNECITNMNEEDLSAFRRRKIGFIFQAFNLVPSLNVWENIILPIGLDDRKPDMVYLKEIIELLGLSEKLNNLPNTLSGGQQQRVAIARALATKPAIVLADEPTGNLDSKTSDEVMALLKTSAMKYEQTLIVITHNEDTYAENRFHGLNDDYRRYIATISSEKIRRDYDSIVSDGDVVSKHNFRLPETIQVPHEAGGKEYRDHLFVSDATGTAKLKLNGWEADLIAEEEKRKDFVCWIRNPSRASWALCIPYEINGEIKPTYPDFIIVREDERLGYVIDILEPHSADFKDNLGKAKGFAEYARQNPGVGRIQLIRMGKDAAGRNQFRRLDMYKTAIREKVSCAINTDELDHIFDTDGVIE